MFAKLAQIRARGRASAPEALAANCNRAPFRPDHCPVRRPTLVCHWHQAPETGALECVWQPAAIPATDRPQSRLSEAVGRPIDIMSQPPGRQVA
jgi:hypothetical protein